MKRKLKAIATRERAIWTLRDNVSIRIALLEKLGEVYEACELQVFSSIVPAMSYLLILCTKVLVYINSVSCRWATQQSMPEHVYKRVEIRYKLFCLCG